MSAEIIPFGEQQRSSRPAAQQPRGRDHPASVERTERELEWLAEDERRRKIEEEVVAVRCTVDGKRYEVRFHGASPWEVSGVHHRNQNGRMVELKYRHWHADHCHCPRDLDTRVVEAARRELNQNGAERSRRLDQEAAIARVHARHAGLLRQAERVKADIALMQAAILPLAAR